METTSKQPNMNLMEEDNKITIVPYKKEISSDLDDISYDVPLKRFFDRESPFMSDKTYTPPQKKAKKKKKFTLLEFNDEEDESESSDDDNLDIIPSQYKLTEVIDMRT